MNENNLLAVQYNERKLQDLKKICSPLHNLNIQDFLYARFYKNNKAVFLTTNSEICKFMLLHSKKGGMRFDNVINKTRTTNFLLWPEESGDDKNIDFIYNCVQMAKPLSLFSRYSNFIETFSFLPSVEKRFDSNFYFEKFSLLERFREYFKETSANIINEAIEQSMADFITKIEFTNKIDQEKSFAKFERFFKKTPIKKHILLYDDKEISLSPQELSVLRLHSFGNTSKEIGRIKNISTRTVESYLCNIKKKSGCFNRSKLFSLFSNNKILIY